MKHESVIIDGPTLVTLMLKHMDDEEVGRALGIGHHMAEYEDGEEYPTVNSELADGYWEVSWPEHVIHAQYNSEANYLGQVAERESELTDEQRRRLHQDSELKLQRALQKART